MVQKLHRNQTTDWIVRAVAPSDAELFRGGKVPNTGEGDCMMLAIADARQRYAPEDKASGRSVRAFLATFCTRHFEEYEALWDGVKLGAKNKQDAGDWKGSFQDYIDGIKI